MTKNINRARVGVSLETITEYFSNSHSILQDIPPFNNLYFETDVSDDLERKKMIFRGGVKYTKKVINRYYLKTTISLIMCGLTCEKLLPPYIIY